VTWAFQWDFSIGSGSSELISKNLRIDAPPVIPLPPAVWLFGSALGLLGWMRRKST
jgi:hypothetical protein